MHDVPPVPRPANVLLVVLDDVPAFWYRHFHDRAPWFGDANVRPFNVALDPGNRTRSANLYAHTPVLDGLASRGITFLNAYANPVCSNNRACIVTGRHPAQHGIGRLVGPSWDLRNAGHLKTLFEMASDAGYSTSMVGKWHLRHWEGPAGPDDTGMDDPVHWAGIQADGGMTDVRASWGNLAATEPIPDGPGQPGRAGSNYNWFLYRNGTVLRFQDPTAANQDCEQNYSANVQFAEASTFIASRRRRPWLCALMLNVAHAPHDNPRPASAIHTGEYDGTTIWRSVMAALEHCDTKLGELLGAMPSDVRSRTHVIFTSDNGSPANVVADAKGPSGKTLGATLEAVLASRRLKGEPYEGGARVPLVVAGPGVSPALFGTTTSALHHSTDHFATIAGLIGAEPPPDLDGLDQRPVLRGDVHEVRGSTLNHRFWPNGDPSTIQGDRETDFVFDDHGFALRLSGNRNPLLNGLFKLVRIYVTTQTWTEELYRLEDGSGAPDDVWEQNDLAGDSFYDARRDEVRAALSQVLGY